MVGDPGFFGTFGKLFRRGVRAGVGFVTGGPAGAARAAFRPPAGGTIRMATNGGRRTGAASEILGRATVRGAGMEMAPRRRRMNVGNAKALRRAIRRTDGFVRLAKSALKNTGFKIVSKSSGRVSRAAMDKAVAAAHHKR